jgi:hypothetical protein
VTAAAAAWASVVLALLTAITATTWRIGSKITRLEDHVLSHDKWHDDRLKRGADQP